MVNNAECSVLKFLNKFDFACGSQIYKNLAWTIKLSFRN